MNTYYYQAPGSDYLQGDFIDAETVGKARYKLWLSGACELYETFGDFIKHLEIRKVGQKAKP
jgi:hypothetical protein